MSIRKLTSKQASFCREYIIDLNATQAAIRAGYSSKTANRIASKLLSKVDIQQEIARLTQEKIEKASVTAQEVIERINNIALKAENQTVELKANELLGKHFALFTDKKIVDSTVKVTGIEIIGVKPGVDK